MAKHKRYYQSMKDRRAESQGEEKYVADNELLRRRMEMEEDGMIHEDRSAVANMPQDVKMKPYPPYGYYSSQAPDDTIDRIDDMMDESDRLEHEFAKPRKA